MRILLAQNSLYYPAHGGGDKSNRMLLEALAARGHACRAVARIPVFGAEGEARYLGELESRGVAAEAREGGAVAFDRGGVEVHVVTTGKQRAYLAGQVEAFGPEIILTSTDDPAQALLDVALRAPGARTVYLARAPIALPFGPDCAFASEVNAARLREAARRVGVSEYVARYIREHGRMEATHVPISLLEPGEPPALGRPENEFVTMVNPCAVKGIAIFLALADAFPEVAFAAVPMWGANQRDRAELARRPNIRILDAVDDIDTLLARTRALLVPSLWAEARSRIVVEAMLRGVPTLASDVGGIPEAKLGVPYLLPVRPIEGYRPELDDQMTPVAIVPDQDIAPWREALAELLCDRKRYEEIARASRAAALEYAAKLSVKPFEALLEEARKEGPRAIAAAAAPAGGQELSAERRQLLALRLRNRAPAAAWFPDAETAGGARLFCFPYAGGGAGTFAGWRQRLPGVCPVRLPGRESRAAEAPFERMGPLVEALAGAIAGYLSAPFAFFGHSMGAAVAFELARELRRRGLPQPRLLVASAARAPQFRRGHAPPAPPTDADFLAELRRLEGVPWDALEDPALLAAILPALKADAALYRNYVYSEEEPLECEIRAYGGARDPNVSEEHLAGWGEQTRGAFAVSRFAGGHFFLHDQREAVLEELGREMAKIRGC